MIGVDATTGRVIEGEQHLAQSIACILTTPIGTREQRRDFGSLLPELIDQPFNDETRLRLFGATATALMRWEPRISLTRIDLVHGDVAGSFVLDLQGQLATPSGASRNTRLSVPLRFHTP